MVFLLEAQRLKPSPLSVQMLLPTLQKPSFKIA